MNISFKCRAIYLEAWLGSEWYATVKRYHKYVEKKGDLFLMLTHLRYLIGKNLGDQLYSGAVVAWKLHDTLLHKLSSGRYY